MPSANLLLLFTPINLHGPACFFATREFAQVNLPLLYSRVTCARSLAQVNLLSLRKSTWASSLVQVNMPLLLMQVKLRRPTCLCCLQLLTSHKYIAHVHLRRSTCPCYLTQNLTNFTCKLGLLLTQVNLHTPTCLCHLRA